MYIITVRRITSGELLKYRKGFCVAGSYGMQRPGSSRFSLTMPLQPVKRVRRLARADLVAPIGLFFVTLIERWRVHYNTRRLHSALRHRQSSAVEPGAQFLAC
jgi:hypothetical protein